MSNRILLSGATGLIGSAIREELSRIESEHDLHLTSRSVPTAPLKNHIPLDLKDLSALSDFLNQLKPTTVVHTGAITSVDKAEMYKPLTERINVGATEVIAKWCSENQARMIHFSTDFVFDGERLDYTESDATNPLSWYGKTKLRSESIVATLCDNYAIVRPILVYGIADNLSRMNFPLLVQAKLAEAQKMMVTADQVRMPTYVEDVASGTIKLMESDYNGVLHLSGPEALSVYDFAQRVADVFELNKSLLEPVSTSEMNQMGQRPLKSGFDISLAKEVIHYAPLSVDDGLKKMRHRMIK